MSDTALAASPSQHTRPVKPASNRMNPRVKQALDHMVWDNMIDNDAAKLVGFSVLYLRLELKKPHIRAYYRGQLEVLRERESSRNIHTLIDVRDQKINQMARVQAVKALEQLDDPVNDRSKASALPGLQIVIVQAGSTTSPQVTIDRAMTIEHE